MDMGKEDARTTRVSGKLKKLKGKKKAKEERKAARTDPYSSKKYVAKEGRKAPGKGMAASIDKKIARKEKKLTKLPSQPSKSVQKDYVPARKDYVPGRSSDTKTDGPPKPTGRFVRGDQKGPMGSSTDMARSAAKTAIEKAMGGGYFAAPASTVDTDRLDWLGPFPDEEEGFAPTPSSPTDLIGEWEDMRPTAEPEEGAEEGAEAEGDDWEDKPWYEKEIPVRAVAAGARGAEAGAKGAYQSIYDLNKNIISWLDDLW